MEIPFTFQPSKNFEISTKKSSIRKKVRRNYSSRYRTDTVRDKAKTLAIELVNTLNKDIILLRSIHSTTTFLDVVVRERRYVVESTDNDSFEMKLERNSTAPQWREYELNALEQEKFVPIEIGATVEHILLIVQKYSLNRAMRVGIRVLSTEWSGMGLPDG
ncbi:hypothetical protein OUZ56_013783 [Daphnia magna]|uniref:Uncharacterized protein n=1 Tax=Daphnia magna TaxID=35525 RepID=A0ABQ9Z822_9CRUS|nr:hypothetical protein OUZ56_013783 [Daphnia magna]